MKRYGQGPAGGILLPNLHKALFVLSNSMGNPQTYQLPSPELQADIYYLTAQEGGRKTPVASGYRGQFHYNGKDFDAMQQFINKPWCQLGETVQVLLQTASPEFHAGQFYTGKAFEIREGAKTVG